jgi:hypothetical protein
MWKAEVKNVSALLKHLNKKHELTDLCCKDLMRYFIYGLCPGRIVIILKTRDGVTVARLWDVERALAWAESVSTADITTLRYRPRCTTRWMQTYKHWDVSGIQ